MWSLVIPKAGYNAETYRDHSRSTGINSSACTLGATPVGRPPKPSKSLKPPNRRGLEPGISVWRVTPRVAPGPAGSPAMCNFMVPIPFLLPLACIAHTVAHISLRELGDLTRLCLEQLRVTSLSLATGSLWRQSSGCMTSCTTVAVSREDLSTEQACKISSIRSMMQ